MLESFGRVHGKFLFLLVTAGVTLMPVVSRSQTKGVASSTSQSQVPSKSQAQAPVQAMDSTQAASTDTDETEPPAPTVSKKPLTEEQVGVYHDLLMSWMQDELTTLNLAIETVPLKREGYEGIQDCLKDFDAEPMPPNVVHRFRAVDGWHIGGDKLRLVVGDLQNQEVEKNDPWNGIKNGKSIEDSVRNGFNHGLFTFSEIQFDKKHERAILTYRFYCGRLCGNGGTVVLTKKDGVWKTTGRCHQWIS